MKTRRNAAKVLDQVKEAMGLAGAGDDAVIPRLGQLMHWRKHLLELGDITNPELLELPLDEQLGILADNPGVLTRLVSGDGRDIKVTTGVHHLRAAMNMASIVIRQQNKTLQKLMEIMGNTGASDEDLVKGVGKIKQYYDCLYDLCLSRNSTLMTPLPAEEVLLKLIAIDGPLYKMLEIAGQERQDPVMQAGLGWFVAKLNTVAFGYKELAKDGKDGVPPRLKEMGRGFEQILGILGLPPEGSVGSVIHSINQYVHWKKHLLALYQTTRPHEEKLYDPKDAVSRLKVIFGNGGIINGMGSGEGFNEVTTKALEVTRGMVCGLLDQPDTPPSSFDGFARLLDQMIIDNHFDKTPKDQSLAIFGVDGYAQQMERGAYELTTPQHRIITAIGDAVVTFAEDSDKHKQLLRMVCVALSIDPEQALNKLPKALSELTTGLRILKGLSRDLNPNSGLQQTEVLEKPLPPAPKVMMVALEGAPGVYKVTEQWFNWFWEVDGYYNGMCSKVSSRKARMTKAIQAHVSSAIEGNMEAWPRGMNLIVNYAEEEGVEISVPTVIFAMNVDSQISNL